MRVIAWRFLLGVIFAQGQLIQLQYNSSLACKWPVCAPTCEACELKPILFHKENAICHMEVCLCKPPYCSKGNKCVPATCYLGAKPPPYKVTGWTSWFGGLAPAEVPPYLANVSWWEDYAKHAAFRLPLVLALAGCLAAVLTSVCLCTGLEQDFGCLPKSPVLLLCWAGMLATFILIGLVHAQNSMRVAYDYGVEQVELLHKDLDYTASLGLQLNMSCAEFKARIDSIPSSCSFSLAETAARGFVDLGHTATQSKWEDVVKVTDVMVDANRTSGEALDALTKFRWYAIHVPMMPMYVMLLGCITVATATVAWWVCHGRGHITECADRVMLRCGDVCIPLLAALSGLLAAIYLATGMVAGKFCLDVDANMLAIARSTNWSAHTHSKLFNVNAIMEAAAMYYIFGNTSNPMIAMMQAAESATHAMDDAIRDSQEMGHLAGHICSGINNINSASWVAEIDSFVSNMTAAASATYVWPYYESFVRVSLCDNIVGALGPLFLISAVLGLFCFPIFGLLSEYDLEEWLDGKDPGHDDTDTDNMTLMNHGHARSPHHVQQDAWGHLQGH